MKLRTPYYPIFKIKFTKLVSGSVFHYILIDNKFLSCGFTKKESNHVLCNGIF